MPAMSTQTLTPNPPALAAKPSPAERSRWLSLPVLLAGTFMIVLDFFIVNVALPSMQRELSASGAAIQWVVAGYALTSAVFLITGARLGDRLGRRRVFCFGLALFTLSSAACAAASSAELLVVGRLAQGLAASLLAPNVLAIIGVTFNGSDRARALGAYGLVMGLAAVCGQLIGGSLMAINLGGLGWRSCFLINVPVGLLAVLLAKRLVPETRGAHSRLDVIGTVLATAAATAILMPLVEGRQEGWPLWSWASLAAAPVVLLAFFAHQRRLTRSAGEPLLDLQLFSQRSFSAGLVTQLAFWCSQASFYLVLALYLQQGRHLSALDAGLVFTILAAAYVLASAQATALTQRYGRGVLLAGALTLAGGFGLLLLAVLEVGVAGSVGALAPGLVLAGAGTGLLIVPVTTLILAGVEPERAGAASGVLSTGQGLGGALGVAVTGAIFFGALHGGYAHAFELSLLELLALLLAVAALTRLIPAPRKG
jgi:EmrB/QacA subfamily drug resistance transporter